MSYLVLLTLIGLGLLLRYFVIRWKSRGERVITCPENNRPAGVKLAASSQLRLRACTRWPEHAGCGQECLTQVEAAPEDCLVRNILIRWYDGKKCAICGQPFGDISLPGAKPAVLSADKVSVEWSEIPADRLPEVLAAGAPICFTCHLGNVLVRTHPELALDRHRAADRSRM
jgi:hypothetical protein